MNFWRRTRAIPLLTFLTFVVLAQFAKAIDVEIKARLEAELDHGRSNLPHLDEQLLGERQRKEAQHEARPRSKVFSGVLGMFHTASKSVRFVGGALTRSIDAAADAVATTIIAGIEAVEQHAEKTKWRRAQRQEDIDIAHSSTEPFSTTDGFGCHSYIPRDYRTTDKILDTDELNVCETLYSSDGAFSAQVTELAKLQVCSEDSSGSKSDCNVVLDGSAWHNWGMTYFEQISRDTKYFFIGVQPVRKIRLQPDIFTKMTVTNKGRWSMSTDEQTLISGGPNWFQRLFIKAEPHSIQLRSHMPVVVRDSDGRVVGHIVQQ